MAKNFRLLEEKVLSRPGAAERLAQLRADTLAEIGLYEIRKASGLTQVELAQKLGITQAAISQLENSGDAKVSTLRTYVEGLGGRLKIVAEFDTTSDSTDASHIEIPLTHTA